MPITPTPSVVADTTTLRCSISALYVLRDNEWDDPTNEGSFDVEQIDDDVVLITIVTHVCQSIDIVEAARHCMKLADVDEVIEVVTHDGSAS